MGCNFIVSKSPWDIEKVAGQEVPPFVIGNNVSVTDNGNETFTVTVRDAEGQQQGNYPGFTCDKDQDLNGTAAGELLRLVPRPRNPSDPTSRNKVDGLWNPDAETDGTWTGDEGGGARDDA